MDGEERIVVDPAVVVGKPIIRGTRVTVEFVVDLLAQPADCRHANLYPLDRH